MAVNEIFSADKVIYLIGLGAMMAFSISGALAAAEKKLDILNFVILGTVTATGGGTLRDVILDTPVFWIIDPVYLQVSILSACFTYLFGSQVKSYVRAIVWVDAIGISLFCVTATAKSLQLGATPIVAITMGMITACFGGILRDIILNREPVMFDPEMYATPTILGGCTYYCLSLTGLNDLMALTISAGLAMLLRSLAITFHWKIPAFKGH